MKHCIKTLSFDDVKQMANVKGRARDSAKRIVTEYTPKIKDGLVDPANLTFVLKDRSTIVPDYIA